jgi:hypothetical protein
VRQNRCYGTSRENNLHIKMTQFLVFTMAFVLVDFRHSSYNKYGDAFVVRERNIVIRRRQDQEMMTCNGRDGYNVCRSGRETITRTESCNFSPFHLVSSRNTFLFDSVVTDQELDQIVAKEQSNLDSRNIIQSTPTTEVTSTPSKTASTTSIELVIPNNGTASASSSSKKVSTMTTDDKATLLGKMRKKSVEKDDADVPQPTANGGYSHTKSSRAKISAANKGKTPWNKGKPRSPEVKARIAAGVRAKNRLVFLKKLEDMGLTEEQHEAKKNEARRIKEADQLARKTANGGYRPTEETKKKISRILKEKHANGEVKRRSKTDPTKVRKGFTHSEETRKKISQSLRKRWQDDEGFQEKMKLSMNSRESSRKRISESLKKKWQDPEFRRDMMEKMSKRKSGKNAMSYDKEHRRKISESMKLKWQDADYREKTLSSIKKSAETRKVTASPSPKKSRESTKTKTKRKSSGIEELKPMTVTDVSDRKAAKKKRVTRKKPTTKKVINDDVGEDVTLVKAVRKPSNQQDKVKGVTASTKTSNSIKLSSEDKPTVEKKKNKKKKKEKDGSVKRLREERRDLFDLLYGDEDGTNDDNDNDAGKLLSDSSSDMGDTLFGDEDLDTFDPYGLDDY